MPYRTIDTLPTLPAMLVCNCPDYVERVSALRFSAWGSTNLLQELPAVSHVSCHVCATMRNEAGAPSRFQLYIE